MSAGAAAGMGLSDREIVDEIVALLDKHAPVKTDQTGEYRVFDRVNAPNLLAEISRVIRRNRMLRLGSG